jgi:hypothetical protein
VLNGGAFTEQAQEAELPDPSGGGEFVSADVALGLIAESYSPSGFQTSASRTQRGCLMQVRFRELVDHADQPGIFDDNRFVDALRSTRYRSYRDT